MHATDVEVYAGNAGPFLHGCIRYETSDEKTTVLVIGITVAGVVLIILVIVLVAVCIYCNRRRDTQMPVADVKMSSVFVVDNYSRW